MGLEEGGALRDDPGGSRAAAGGCSAGSAFSTAWFKKHPEVDIVSRDRGKIFREAADAGAPHAKHVVDRFHLQKNFAEALEKFFRHHKHLLKAVTYQLAGKAHPAPKSVAERQIEQEREQRHQQIWTLCACPIPQRGHRNDDRDRKQQRLSSTGARTSASPRNPSPYRACG